jgi:pimeloyl-ACP methyl ester carboxylesterase
MPVYFPSNVQIGSQSTAGGCDASSLARARKRGGSSAESGGMSTRKGALAQSSAADQIPQNGSAAGGMMQPPFGLQNLLPRLSGDAAVAAGQWQRMLIALSRHADTIARGHGDRFRALAARGENVAEQLVRLGSATAVSDAALSYAVDAVQRAILTADVLRQRGNNDLAHEAAGAPPVLNYKSELIVDGGSLPRPVNYLLLRVLPPAGFEVAPSKRPYMLVDPRAGHGAGIGGFKPDSQVGVALRAGHPVYFVVFRPHPEPGQTIADVAQALAAFVTQIARRHPDRGKPIVVGNCQGGWITMLLAAANPDLTGPIVVNGAPLTYWSGRIGHNPMRYNGGLLGGAVPALLLADLGHGEFDGAHLVANFEQLDPGRNLFRKYYDLFADVESNRARFLDFERWWGGFHFTTEAEIRWILEQLFVGNRLSRGEASIAHGHHLDLRLVRAPIIVFASWGDNITPPQQALNWIADTYADENEIRIRGQRVLYMVHDKVGHLGIFVSSSVARREHSELTTTMETIEALAPGLYEMKIEEETGQGYDAHFLVSFHERTLKDLLKIDDNGRSDESDFAAVARLSELGTELYDICVRPAVQSLVTPQAARLLQQLHPLRLQRRLFSDQSPLAAATGIAAGMVEAQRKPAAQDNPFLLAERLWADGFEQMLDLLSEWRDTWYEFLFQAVYGSPFMHWIGRTHDYKRTFAATAELRHVPQIATMLRNVARGGFAEAVIRMLIILAEARGSVRRDRLQRSSHVLTHDEPFASLGAQQRGDLIHEQTVIVQFERQRAIETLPILLHTAAQREKAVAVVEYIAGPLEEMEPRTLQALQQFRKVLGLALRDLAIPQSDPLQNSNVALLEDGVTAPVGDAAE